MDISQLYWEIEQEIKELNNDEISTCWDFAYGDASDENKDPESDQGGRIYHSPRL